MKRSFVTVLALLLGPVVLPVRADAPRAIPLQAVVTSLSGVRIDGTRSVTFTLYDAGGASRWTETKSVVITQGLLTTMLGDATPFPAGFSFDQPYSLGIRVGADSEMTPRLPLGTVPYAGSLLLPYAGSTAAPAGTSALSVISTGAGSAARFDIANATNDGSVLTAATTGTGHAGRFVIDNQANSSSALYAATNGNGQAGSFLITNPSSYEDTLEIRNYGNGCAGNFEINNHNNTAIGVRSITNGLGVAIFGSTSGAGSAGSFEIDNSSSTADALASITEGKGSAVNGVNTFSGTGSTYGVRGESRSSTGRGIFGWAEHATGVNYGIRAGTNSPNGYGVWSSGDLHVVGDISATGSKSGYVTDTVLNDDTEPLSPGDVVEITGAADPVQGDIPVMRVRKARAEGSTAILGPVDCALSLSPIEEMERRGRNMGKGQMHTHRTEGAIPVGGYGRVVTLGAFRTVKVDASSSPIRPGDLLVSSSRPGYAMAALQPETGTVIGKALGSLATGTGEMPVFVSPR